jgi:hypothetical protein
LSLHLFCQLAFWRIPETAIPIENVAAYPGILRPCRLEINPQAEVTKPS